ncbi:MAG: ferrochelatase [Bdellovibrionales bacterium]|nr:ferrochelatase [Bdellovibrionales bacterium]
MAERGLLLINLGSPDAPTAPAVGKYLKEFLNDKYVIDLPPPFRQFLVWGLIAPLRSHSSAHAYQKIWTEEGSPLVGHTRAFAQDLAVAMPATEIRWAMRYGSPSILDTLKNWKVRRLDVVPLYPQYAESSTRTAIEQTKKGLIGFPGEVRWLQDFYDQPEYIAAEVRQIQQAMQSFQPDHLLLSFHGLPEHHMAKLHPRVCGQEPHNCERVTAENRLCYRAQCFATARAVAAGLGKGGYGFSVSFQSRLGRRPWVKPYTDFVINDLAAEGKKRVLVACPSFVADCLETLEEVQIRLRDQFIAKGGEDLKLVPSLNSESHWVQGFQKMIARSDLAWQNLGF